MTLKRKNNTVVWGAGCARAVPGPAPLWHRWVWDGHSSRSEEACVPTEYFLRIVFWYKINAKERQGRGAVEAGPAILPRPQIMATLSGAQLRCVEALLLPEDLQARPGAGCSAATSVSEETAPNS